MHESVMAYVRRIASDHALHSARVLDVGSLDVNGSVRELFVGDYTGIDMRPGPNVDQVVDAHEIDLHFSAGTFDVVVCCEMLEHDSAFWISLPAMGRVLRPGGRLILTTRGVGFPVHEHPSDYWRFTTEAGHLLAEMAGLEDAEVEADPQADGIFLTGVRRA